MTELST